MKNIKYFILGFILASIVFTSCDIDTCDESVFDDCYLDEPIDAFFVLNISKNANQDSVLIMLYKGKIDDGEMIDSFYSYLEEESYYLDVDQYY
ncbi:MAG: hypothetical protein U9R19_07395, partial [Bacteroidota bacterium]|nr:hypothetical protein [Bacteroidota bacterium]